jgi:hypothetical protein
VRRIRSILFVWAISNHPIFGTDIS